MGQYLFRVEAVNLAPTVYDTSDISTIRGGGFYLLNRVRQLAQKSQYENYLVTEGASTAVFKIETDNPDECREKMLKFLYGQLDGDKAIKEMMFLVEYMELSCSFQEAMAQLMGKIRLAQMRSPSVRVFEDNLNPTGNMRFDELNRVLPAHKKDAEKDVSDFTCDRRKQGRQLRKKIYLELLGEDSQDFTDSLEELSLDPNQGNLNGKIAYIYLDGNKFGAMQKNFSEKQFKKYDQKLQDLKKAFLAEIIKLVPSYKSFLYGNKKVRLETLLWGGDELKLIVPAWLGWKVASLFFGLTKNADLKMDSKEMTYAMGLVFAHHKNPVRNISRVADELVAAAKGAIPPGQAYNREQADKMHYIVLESLETLPSSYPDFCREYYKTDSTELCLSPQDMEQLKKFAVLLDAGFPRSRVYRIAAAWAIRNDSLYADLVRDGLACYEGSEADRKNLYELIQNFTGTQVNDGVVSQSRAACGYRWLQVSELWDYLVWKEK